MRFVPLPIRAYLRVKALCSELESRRGIWKQIDENRELLLCIQEHAPNLLTQCPWVDGWIAETDIFLNNLAVALELKVPIWMLQLHTPRPWPGRFNVEKFYTGAAPASCMSSDASHGEQAMGND